MHKTIVLCFKGLRKLCELSVIQTHSPLTKLLLRLNGATFGNGLKALGLPYVNVTRTGKLTVGCNLRLNSGSNYNIIGRQQKSIFWISGNLTIGNNVGMSATAIICTKEIVLGNNIIIGGNSVIYDTDFHSLNIDDRLNGNDKLKAKALRVEIKDGVFIGAHSTILKGVTIGENAIIGACSVVTKDVPSNEIWAGNPAKFIKRNLLNSE